MSTLNDKVKGMIVREAEIQSYFATRDNDEHTNIHNPSSYIEQVQEYFNGDYHKGVTLPWEKTYDGFRVRPGEASIVSGFSGSGKSMILSQMSLGLLEKDYKTMLASFELQPRSSLARLLRQVSGSRLPSNEFIDEKINSLDGKLYLYDQQGTVGVESIISVIYYSAEVLDCKIVIVDSLMKCGVAEDDYEGQKKFIDRICVAARDLNIHIFVVAHSKKSNSEYTDAPTKHSVSGSTHITNLVDNVFVVHRTHRDQRLELGQISQEDFVNIPDAQLYLVKQRHYEYEGHWNFDFNPESLTYA